MAFKVVMPKLGLTMAEGLLSRWLVEDGEAVRKGQPIFEIETDKASIEAEAGADGILRLVVEAGSTVPVMGLVGYILAPGEEMAGVTQFPPGADETRQPVVSQVPAESPPQPTQRRLASPAARRRARELKVDINQVQGTGQGGRITIADVEAFVEAQAKESAPVATRVLASPLARRMAEEVGVDLATIQGSGQGGRITKEDVEQAMAAGQAALAPAEAPSPEGEVIPIKGVRAIIAERMLASSQGTAAVTITTEADAMELVNMRTQLNEGLSQQLGFPISYNDILVKILARALRELPYMNARQEGDVIRLLPEVNVGVAVDTERGLLVPVVPNAYGKSLVQIGRELRDKVERAIAGKSLPDELSGGTFTMTNLGMMDVDAFTPLINPPEMAVLGVGRIVQKPVAYQGEVRLRERMVLSLTFDHRLVDGAPAARFLGRVKDLIEKPYLMMVDGVG
jgi:pyruvate dehydrogenase E2 component (dihydrolipoamide acetyltransferase)